MIYYNIFLVSGLSSIWVMDHIKRRLKARLNYSYLRADKITINYHQYEYGATAKIKRKLKEVPRNSKNILIGHSWGGSAACRIAHSENFYYSRNKIDYLYLVDPCGAINANNFRQLHNIMGSRWRMRLVRRGNDYSLPECICPESPSRTGWHREDKVAFDGGWWSYTNHIIKKLNDAGFSENHIITRPPGAGSSGQYHHNDAEKIMNDYGYFSEIKLVCSYYYRKFSDDPKRKDKSIADLIADSTEDETIKKEPVHSKNNKQDAALERRISEGRKRRMREARIRAQHRLEMGNYPNKNKEDLL